MTDPHGSDPLQRFIRRWSASGASERANYQLFLTELCELLDLPRPEPATPDDARNSYVFERAVTFHHGDGSTSTGFIDLYRRGCFVLEAKQGSDAITTPAGNRAGRTGTARRGTASWDSAMLRARGQAEQYARALPAGEGRPPFVVVVDVGHSIELYSEFTRSGGSYVPYPDPRSHRIRLTELTDERHRETLRRLWLEPLALDPARHAARVTRAIAAKLARLAQALERAGHDPDRVAAFLMRCLFTMFAEDVGLLPRNAFTELLASVAGHPEHFTPLAFELWQAMDKGGFSAALRTDLLRFNGGLFAAPEALALDRAQIELLIEAARADWRHVEPAIFGTLLEQALDPVERHRLGAHYTPRAYVERLVLPTIVEPLREDWQAVQAAALTLDNQGKPKQAVQQVRDFHQRLCQTRVLDPACGSGNFLYVTLEHLKRLEGEVLNTLEELGEAQSLLELAGVTVDPQQMLGIEINPRAVKIAEAVLWIGYLQWHYRTRGNVSPPEPVLKDFHNIECRDAVLAWERIELVTDAAGRPVTRWDGRTTQPHPVTGEPVPDETARVPLERYVNPRPAAWPEAEFVIGNPPFVGTKRMRQVLGDGYVDALRRTYSKNVPDSADYVMYWWQQAAELTHAGQLRRFGLITTNSLRQTFNRRVIQSFLEDKRPLSLVFAIPDHPWVDTADGAAVRIAMTVAEAGEHEGQLNTVCSEQDSGGDGREVVLKLKHGRLFADLSIGANVAGAVPLRANSGISGMGVALHGAGFILEPDQAEKLRRHGPSIIKGYLGGRDLLQVPRERYLIDFSGLTEDEARRANLPAFQHVIDYVKPERDHNNRKSIRELWWRFGWERPLLKRAILDLRRYIGTTETAKHRTFQFIAHELVADHMVVCFALDDAYHLGVLSSRIHVCWALAAGGRLGVGNDPRYNKTRCFETFPFPAASEEQRQRIRDLAERLDAHRKRQQAEHPGLTLTGLYNVLEKLRAGAALTDKERIIHDHGLVAVLRQLHDDLDGAVAAAYGWPADLTAEAILVRLVALNAERAAEERRGLIRWLRPEFQNPEGRPPTRTEVETGAATVVAARDRQPWPRTLPEQVQAIRRLLGGQPLTADQLAARFRNARRDKVEELLDTLTALGQARRFTDGQYARG